jgi:hypothetical protein
LLLAAQVNARPTANVKMSVERAENQRESGANTLVLPYAFSTESMGTVIGLGGMRNSFYQEQMTVGGTFFGGKESHGMAGGVWDFKVPYFNRLFVSAIGMIGYYPRQRAYTSGSFFVPDGIAPPGSNDSSQDLFIQARGSSNWLDMKAEYALPIGAAREQGMIEYQLSQGLLTSKPSGGEHWNPLTSGATVLTLRQYNRYQSYENDERKIEGTVHPFELGILYDNTDFPTNPSKGSSQYLAISHDPAWFDSKDKWTFVELEASKYFSLGSSRHAHQRIIALNAWTAYSPSWDVETDDTGATRAVNAPPFMEGSTLGGFYRLRGYDMNRFHDKAAIYGTAEYRYTLRYNPIKDVQWLRFLNLDWFQLVGFVEGGRVAPSYTSGELFKDWKSDIGFSLRALTAGVIVRFDVAHSPESTNMWVMVSHPF